MAVMLKRIVKSPLQVFRDGKWIEPKVGEAFDFTEKEAKELTGVNPDCLGFIETVDEPAKTTEKPKV